MPATALRVPQLARPRLGRMDDARLASLAAEGDERAFEALYDRHHRPLLGFCRHMLGSPEEAEDALQQTFLRAHRALVARGAPTDVRPWLYTIARNRCLSLLSARKPPPADADEAEPAVEGLGAAVERRADLRALLGDIARLPEDQRAALVLSEIADLSHAEIGAVIDVPRGKVKALVHQARTRLMADREARELPCPEVREVLATATGGELRRGPLRRHLAVCEGCSDYRDAIREQRAALKLVLPVVPSAGLKEAILGVFGGGGGGGAVAALTGGSGLGAKLAVGVVIAGGGGAVAVHERAQPARSASATATPTATATSTPTTTPAPVRASAPATTVVTGTVAKPPRRRGKTVAKARGLERRAQTPAGPKPAKEQRAEAREQAKEQRTAAREQRKAAKPVKVKPAKPVKVKPAKPVKVKPVKVKKAKPPQAAAPLAAAPTTPPGQAKKEDKALKER